MDIGSKSEILELIRGLGASGMSVIIISDDIQELMQACNRICVMKNGGIAGTLSVEDGADGLIRQMLME